MPSRHAVKFRVYVDGSYQPGLVPLTINRSAGGQSMDSCELINDPRYRDAFHDVGAYQENYGIRLMPNSIITVTSDANGVERQVFWGKITRQKVVIQEGNAGEHLYSVARIEDFHFGQPIRGVFMMDEFSGEIQAVDMPQIVFNPIHEHKPVGNKRDGEFVEFDIPCFTDPETLPLDVPDFEVDNIGQFWTLAEVVYYLCQVGNREQKYIKNPQLSDLKNLFSKDDLIRHLPLKNGLYLPKALDAVLQPFGYNWGVFPADNDRPTIGMWKRGSGIKTLSVHLGSPLTPIDGDNPTNLANCDIQFDASAAYNSVEGMGGFIEVESTFTLIRAWPANKDALGTTHPDQLELTYLNEHPENKAIWRKWVLNEGGDYKDVRDGAGYDTAFDFEAITQEAEDDVGESIWCQKRRRFHPTLTLDNTGHPIGKIQGCKVEYYNGNTGVTNGWKEVTDEVEILHKECGVYFSGRHAPQEIIRQGTSAKVRVTATIRFDVQLRRVAEVKRGSPLADEQRLVLDLHDRFHWRMIDDSSKYKTQVDDGELLANASDDREDLEAYVEAIREAWDQASVNGPLTLEGCDWDYDLGVAISGITGRNINFETRFTNQQYPTIIGVTYDCQAQRTHLVLDQYRKAKLLRYAQDRQGIDHTG